VIHHHASPDARTSATSFTRQPPRPTGPVLEFSPPRPIPSRHLTAQRSGIGGTSTGDSASTAAYVTGSQAAGSTRETDEFSARRRPGAPTDTADTETTDAHTTALRLWPRPRRA